MLKPVQIREFFLVDGDKLVPSRVGSIQRVVRQMIKRAPPKTLPPKKKRSSS